MIRTGETVYMILQDTTIPGRGIRAAGETVLGSEFQDPDYFDLLLQDKRMVPAGRVTGSRDNGRYNWTAFSAFEKVLLATGLDNYLEEHRHDMRLLGRIARLISAGLPDFLASVEKEMKAEAVEGAGGKK